MRRRLNWKAVIILSVFLALVLPGGFFLHRHQVRANSRALLDQADLTRNAREALVTEKGEATEAEVAKLLTREIDYLRRYLGFNPKETDEVLERYGLLMADERVATTGMARFRALTVLEQVMGRGEGKPELRRKVVELAMSVGRFNDAAAHIDHVIPLNKVVHRSPTSEPDKVDDPEWRTLRGRCYQELGQYAAARQDYEVAAGLPGAGAESSGRLAYLLRNEADGLRAERSESPADLAEQADHHIDQMVANRPDDYKARLVRAEYIRSFGMTAGAATVLDAAQADVDEAVRLGKDEPEVLFALADVALLRRAPDLARSFLETGIAKHAKNARLYLALANLERAAGRLTKSAEVLRRGLGKLPSNLDLLWALADVLVEAKSADADDAIKRLGLAGLGEAELGVLRGRQYANAEKWGQAVEEMGKAFDSLRVQLGRGRDSFRVDLARQAGLLLGAYQERAGDHDAAHDAYRLVLESVDDRSLPALVGMARARRSAGRSQEALAEYTRLASLPGGPAYALVERARITLQINAVRQDPDWVAVDRALSAAEERLRPLPVEVVLIRLEMLARQAGRLQEARAHLDWLLYSTLTAPVRFDDLLTKPLRADEPLPLYLYVAKAYLFDAEGSAAAAESARLVIEEGRRLYGDDPAVRDAQIRHWASVTDGEAAKKALGGIERELAKLSVAEKRAPMMALATAYLKHQDKEGARRVWEKVAEENATDVPSRVALFVLALAADDDGRMQKQLDALKVIEGERGIQWRYATVRQLIRKAARDKDDEMRKSDLLKADALLKVITARRPGWSRATLAEAQVADLRNETKVALEAYVKAIGQGERGAATIQRAVVLSSRTGGAASQRAALLSKLSDSNRTGVIKRIEVEDALSGGDIDTAVRLAKEDVNDTEGKLKASEDDAGRRSAAVYAHWYLGQVLQSQAQMAKSGDDRKRALEEAEAALRRATDLDRKSVLAWSGLALFLASVKPEQAKAAVAELEGLTRDPATLAPCYEAVGQFDKAEKAYIAVLQKTQNRSSEAVAIDALSRFYLRQGQTAKAMVQMEKLVTSSSPEAQELKRILALLKTRTGTYKDAKATLQGMGSADGLPPGADAVAVGDQRARAAILSLLPGRENRAQAIKLLTDLVFKKKHVPNDLLTLARLHERQGDWKSARLYLEAVEATGGANAAVALAPLTRGLLRQDVAEARRAVDRLKKAAPRAFVTAELEARVLHAEKKTDEAVALLMGALKGQETLTNLQLAAAAVETMGRKGEAEKLYQRVVAVGKNSSQSLQMLVGFYARQKEAKKALAVCDQVWPSRPADAADLSLIVLAAMPRDAEVLRRLDAQFTKARAAAPGDAALASAQGHLRVMQERYKDAETLYGVALNADPKNVITRNNLAWLLGLQPGRAEEALKLTQEVINQVGPRPWVLDTQGVALLTLGQTKESLARLKESTEEDPTPTSNFHYAWALSQDKQTALAKVKLLEALKAGLKDTDLHPLERPVLARLCKELEVTPPSP